MKLKKLNLFLSIILLTLMTFCNSNAQDQPTSINSVIKEAKEIGAKIDFKGGFELELEPGEGKTYEVNAESEYLFVKVVSSNDDKEIYIIPYSSIHSIEWEPEDRGSTSYLTIYVNRRL